MATLTIPEEHRQGLLKLVDLSDEQFDQLMMSLSKSQAKDLRGLRRSAAESSSVPSADLAEIMGTLVGLYFVRSRAEIPTIEFVDDVIDALREFDTTRAVEERVPYLQSRLGRAFGIDRLITITKALELRNEHNRTFCDAKILTDLRPVFQEDPSSPPTGAVIIHTLKIEYHEDEEHKEFFVALDRHDIATLTRVLERATAKAKSLSETLRERLAVLD